MGYYGLGPGMRVADQLTALEAALRSIPMTNWFVTLDIMEKIFRNVAQNPKEEKFRKLKLTNAKISANITSIAGAVEALLYVGWEMSTDGEETVLVLPEKVKFTFPEHVNKIIDAKQFFKKEEEKTRVERGLSRVDPRPASEYTSLFSETRTADQIQEDAKGNIMKYRNAIVKN